MSKNHGNNNYRNQNQNQNNGNQGTGQNNQNQGQNQGQEQKQEKTYPVPTKNSRNEQISEGLRVFDALFSVQGHIYNTNTDQLANLATENLRAKLPQVNKVIIKPFKDTNIRGRGDLRFLAFVVFDLTAGEDLTMTGNVEGLEGLTSEEMEIYGVHGIKGINQFSPSKQFKEVMGPIAECNRNGEFYIERNPEKFGGSVASVPVDFFSLICSILGIDNNSPFDYRVEKCEWTGKTWAIELKIYYDNGSRRKPGFTKSGNAINYDVITDHMMSKIK